MKTRSHFKMQLYELIILVAVVVNLVFFLVDSFYGSFYTRINYVLIVSGFLAVIATGKIRIKRTLLFGYVSLVLLAVLALHLNHSSVSTVVQLIWPLTLLVILSGKTLSESFINAVIRTSKLFILLYVAKTLFLYRGSDMSLYMTRNGYVNANSTGLILIYLFWTSTIRNEKRGFNRSELIWIALVFTGVWFTNSRTSLLVFIGTIVLQLFFYERLRVNRKFLFVCLSIILVAGFAIPLIYVFLYESRMMGGATFFGKRLFTGREWIWMNTFNYFHQNPITFIIGTGYNDMFNLQGSFNLHNAYIMLATQYGLLVTIGYLACILRILWKSYNSGKLSPLKIKMVFVILTVLLVGLTEITLSYVPLLIFPGIALGILDNERSEI